MPIPHSRSLIGVRFSWCAHALLGCRLRSCSRSRTVSECQIQNMRTTWVWHADRRLHSHISVSEMCSYVVGMKGPPNFSSTCAALAHTLSLRVSATCASDAPAPPDRPRLRRATRASAAPAPPDRQRRACAPRSSLAYDRGVTLLAVWVAVNNRCIAAAATPISALIFSTVREDPSCYWSGAEHKGEKRTPKSP